MTADRARMAVARRVLDQVFRELRANAGLIGEVLDAAALGDRAFTAHAPTLDDWLPDPQVTDLARYVLDVNSGGRDMLAVIPLYMPGKERGWWPADGQEVVTLPTVLIGMNSFDAPPDGPFPDLHTAQSQASRLAYRAMALAGDGSGTAGYAVVSREPGRHVPVWEEILDLPTLDRLAAGEGT